MKNVIDEVRHYIPETVANMLPQPMHRLVEYWGGSPSARTLRALPVSGNITTPLPPRRTTIIKGR